MIDKGVYIVKIKDYNELKEKRKKQRCFCKIVSVAKELVGYYGVIEVNRKCYEYCPDSIEIIGKLDEEECSTEEMRSISRYKKKIITKDKVMFDLGEEERVVIIR